MGEIRTLSYDSSAGARQATDVSSLTVVLEAARPQAGSRKHLLAGLDHVVVGRGEPAGAERDRGAPAPTLRLQLDDPWMSGRHFELTRDGTSWRLRDAGSKNGTRVAGQPAGEAALGDGDLIEAGGAVFLFRHREAAPGGLTAAAEATAGAGGLRSLHLELAHELGELAHIARGDVAVLLAGETGTGKEVVARAVHAVSGRRGRFVAVNCAALPSTLAAAELFGVKKGAFSGAGEDRPGLVRAADGGTLLLDEIGDLSLELQPVLLRVLQEREVTPMVDTRAQRVDVRVVAASHADLDDQVAAGRFRRDLLARLAGFRLELPALRERREDLGSVIADLLARIAPETPWRLERAAARALAAYDWPANVRELEQALRSACALARKGEIQLAHLPAAVRAAEPRPTAPAAPRERLDDDRLRALWQEHQGNVSALARALASVAAQVRRLLKRAGLASGD